MVPVKKFGAIDYKPNNKNKLKRILQLKIQTFCSSETLNFQIRTGLSI